jgi:hypothetical protein
MKLGPTLVTILSGLCISSAVASAQSAICGGDGEANSTAAPVACVTGAGVQVTTTPAAGEKWEAPPLAPEQRPAEVPNVTYIEGKLRVVAKNAILSDILKAIAAKTGAAIEIPEGADERVVSLLGPAPARDVIAALLNGSHYNYVLVGTEADSAEVARVIVTAKTEKADTGTAVAAGARPAMIQPRNALQAAVMQPYQEMLQQQQAQQAAAQEMQAQITSEITEQGAQGANNEASTPAPAPASTPDAGSASAPVEAPPAAEAPRAGSGANADKTPQQMLQDLYETRRQMMQQQHQPQSNQ